MVKAKPKKEKKRTTKNEDYQELKTPEKDQQFTPPRNDKNESISKSRDVSN